MLDCLTRIDQVDRRIRQRQVDAVGLEVLATIPVGETKTVGLVRGLFQRFLRYIEGISELTSVQLRKDVGESPAAASEIYADQIFHGADVEVRENLGTPVVSLLPRQW